MSTEMTTQKQRFPSFASTISVLSIVFYCVGFLRVEFELNDQKMRIDALENTAKKDMEIIVFIPRKNFSVRS